jgi:hypothetical protein
MTYAMHIIEFFPFLLLSSSKKSKGSGHLVLHKLQAYSSACHSFMDADRNTWMKNNRFLSLTMITFAPVYSHNPYNIAQEGQMIPAYAVRYIT